MGRAPCCSKVGLHRGPWTAREDALLIKYIEAHGEGQWRSLPKKAGLLRCGKSCRLRWMNYLRPDIKRGNITPDEDDLIIRLHGLLGNRWSLIAGRLPGRTDNEIKNYWNTHLSKRLRTQGTDPNTHRKLSEADPEKPTPAANKTRKRRSRSSTNFKRQTQKLNNELQDQEKRERTKIHLPIPVRVTSMISSSSLTRNKSSNGSLETNVSTTISASSSQSQSQSQSQSYGVVTFDQENSNVILDMPWLSSSSSDQNGDINMHMMAAADENDHGLDHLMMMGSCADHHDVDFDITQHPHDHQVTAPDKYTCQFEKLYEEYVQLIKVDDHEHHRGDGDEAQLDSFTGSFLI